MWRRILACIMLAVLLSGCATDSAESSLRVPEIPAEFIEFNDELNKIKAQGMELVTPGGGTNRQSVQLADLDGDGVDEGIALFREMANSYKCYVYIFKKNNDGYEVMSKIEGAGNSVDSIAYADTLGNGNNDVIIGWSVSDSDARAVTVHTIVDGYMKKLCEIAGLYYLIYDMNDDTISDLCVVYEDATDGMQRLAVYMAKENGLEPCGTAPLSQNSEKILRIRAGYASDGVPAIFVEKEYNSSGLVTDIIIWEDEELKNLTYSDEEKMSIITARNSANFCEDIDSDTALEIPVSQEISVEYAPVDSELLTGFVWYGFDEKSRFVKKAYTFRQTSENWYLSLPRDWISKTTAAHYKDDFSHTTTTFYGIGSKEPEALFTIAVISGENREKYTEQLGYEKILERNNVIYAVDIHKKRYLGYDITVQMLTERFYYSSGEWSTGEVVF